MQLNHLALILLVCLAWSFNFTEGAKGMQHFSPLLFMILRFTLLLLAVFPFLRLPPRTQWFRLVTVCLLIGALHFTVMFWALARSADVSSVAIVQQTYIPMAVVLAVLLLGEKLAGGPSWLPPLHLPVSWLLVSIRWSFRNPTC
jgi:O-acetylserine/cysteine efflux transporter